MALLKLLGFSISAAAITAASSSAFTNSSQNCRLGNNFIKPNLLGPARTLKTAFCASPATSRAQATHLQTSMETSQSNKDVLDDLQSNKDVLPDLMTEYMVDMKCEGCVSAVRNNLETLDGVKRVDVDLPSQVVRILGSSSLKSMTTAFEETGRKARLIGQGSPEDFLVSAAVAEFKGPEIIGVVRLAQVNVELSRVEASFTGLSPGVHGWTLNEYGDLTKGAASTGKIYNPSSMIISEEPLGDLGTLVAGDNGEANFVGVKHKLKVGDLIGRAVVLYEGEDKSKNGIAAAVIARSAGVGENYKQICACDGTILWESTNSDYVKA